MTVQAAFIFPHPPLIIPAVGRGGEKQIAPTAAACEEAAARIAEIRPDLIFLTSPHSVMYGDYFHLSPGSSARGSLASFGAPDEICQADYDSEFVSALAEEAEAEGLPAGTLGEQDSDLDHGTMVPLWFVRRQYRDFRLVRCGLSGLSFGDHYRLGMLVARISARLGRRTVFLASGDLSHKLKDSGPYGFAPEGPEYDRRIQEVCRSGDFGELFDFDHGFCSRAAECGHRSFLIMAGALDGRQVQSQLLSHQDVTGVGYGVASFIPGDPDPARRFLEIRQQGILTRRAQLLEHSDPYVRLAVQTLEDHVNRRGLRDLPPDLPREMTERRAGVFVSLHKEGELRGCIGTIAPVTSCIAREIMDNAVSACSRDPRFEPVRPDELPYLDVNVDVLGEAEDITSPAELDVRRYGVIVTSGMRRGLLLPDLEGVDTVEQQIAIARRKAGIGAGEKISLQRFEVVRHRMGEGA